MRETHNPRTLFYFVTLFHMKRKNWKKYIGLFRAILPEKTRMML